MAIPYRLVPSEDSDSPGAYRAEVVFSGTCDVDMLIERIIDRYPDSTREALKEALDQAQAEAMSAARQGKHVRFGGLFELIPRLRRPDGTYEVEIVPGEAIHKAMQNAKPVKVEHVEFDPRPVLYRDTHTGTTNDQVTPSERGRLKGDHLRFDIAQAEEGVFFIHRRSGRATRVEHTLEANLDDPCPRLPHELAFLVPASLQPGTYILEVRSRTREGGVLRSGRLERVLAVPEASSGP